MSILLAFVLEWAVSLVREYVLSLLYPYINLRYRKYFKRLFKFFFFKLFFILFAIFCWNYHLKYVKFTLKLIISDSVLFFQYFHSFLDNIILYLEDAKGFNFFREMS
jgi:hypothetical protein